MKTTPENPPAFPHSMPYYGPGIRVSMQEGMDLRDWFAGMALQGDLASQSIEIGYYNREDWQVDAAHNAYRLADAMLTARQTKP